MKPLALTSDTQEDSRVTLVMVDGGWFLRQATLAVTGRCDIPRERIKADIDALVRLLIQQAQEITGLPVPAIYWYDAARDDRPPTPEHEALAAHPLVELRLGKLRHQGGSWVQKRVDTLISRDMMVAAMSGVVGQIALVSGDEDLVVPTETVQADGVTVRMLVPEYPEVESQGVFLSGAVSDVHALPAGPLSKAISVPGVATSLIARRGVARVLAATA